MVLVNHYSSASAAASDQAKQAEIMARYRPIAPKPAPASALTEESPRINESEYLRAMWPQLQARPTRTRKRGRTAFSPPPSSLFKRYTRPFPFNFPPPPAQQPPPPPPNFRSLVSTICVQGVPCYPSLHHFQTSTSILSQLTHQIKPPSPQNLVTLSLLPCTPEHRSCMDSRDQELERIIDLNKMAPTEVPEERNLILQLQVPYPSSNLVTPQAIRPVGSIITVSSISEKPTGNGDPLQLQLQPPKSRKQVLDELEAEKNPAIITDSNNKVKMANSAYKEMVGQPECLWLDSMAADDACKRICGTVGLHFIDREVIPSLDSNGFTCWANIEWSVDGVKNSITAFCQGIRLVCEVKDYLFLWKFHTHTQDSLSLQNVFRI